MGILVGVSMVVVVLDAPGLERVDEGHEHESAHDVLHQLVLAEAAVPAVVPDHKHLHTQAPDYSSKQGVGPASSLPIGR